MIVASFEGKASGVTERDMTERNFYTLEDADTAMARLREMVASRELPAGINVSSNGCIVSLVIPVGVDVRATCASLKKIYASGQLPRSAAAGRSKQNSANGGYASRNEPPSFDHT